MSICTLTEAAKIQINKLCEENDVWGISLNIKGGGCAGFEYDWGTVTAPEDTEIGDEVINALHELFDAGERSSPNGFVGDQCEESLDLIEPRAVSRDEVHVPAWPGG